MSVTLDLAIDLIFRPSVTPEDAGCQALIAERLRTLGFSVEHLDVGDVRNLWARRGNTGPLFVFAGHTDVVPSGPLSAWSSPPFEPEIRGDHLYGRGAADMKGSLAAMVTATEGFVAQHPHHPGSIGFLITSDEEGPAVDGTVKVIEQLRAREETIDWCVVGEPSSSEVLGDMVRIGRRGSLHGHLEVKGIQGHVAYPHLADNPIHACAPALAALSEVAWDQGSADFPPTSFQISNIRAGSGALNVIPGHLEADFNFRNSNAVSHKELREQTEDVLSRHGLDFTVAWDSSGEPFLTRRGALTHTVVETIIELNGIAPELSTGGGTSDGRFIAPTGAQVVEIGPVNTTVHRVDECVKIDDLERLADLYQRILEKLLILNEPR